MKRIAAAILTLMLLIGSPASAEEAPPVWEKAIKLYEIIMAPASFVSFGDAPDAELAAEMIESYLRFMEIPLEAADYEAVYRALFVNGAFSKPQNDFERSESLPVCARVEAVTDTGVGTLIVTLRVERDYGDGFEFDFYVDVHILPDEEAPFGAKIARVFIPE